MRPDTIDLDKGFHNLSVPRLVELSVIRGEGILTARGALSVNTGKYTGRSPDDKFIVDSSDQVRQLIWWEKNKPFSATDFEQLKSRVCDHLVGKELFVFDGFVGADERIRIPMRVVTETAWHCLFATQAFLRSNHGEAREGNPFITVIHAPSFKAVPERDGTRSEAFIIIDFEKGLILIGGTSYAGEIKKSVFTFMNFLLPQRGIMPMHCSANVGKRGDVALFFGLSGTGKTSLSADPERLLIGDDQHGWSNEGVFNFEGGCYAKCIRLSMEREPQIWQAIRFGAVIENVVVDPSTRIPDFDDDSITENTRAAYPVDHIPGAVIPGVGGHPETIFFLTADAFGVLPPISLLSHEQAITYFLLGYTSKLAQTERGVNEPEATFSPCFAQPFLPLPPTSYAELLREKLRHHDSKVFLVNTGWTGGRYGVGTRIPIEFTRRMVSAAIEDKLEGPFRTHPVFGLEIPSGCPGVPERVLDPRESWPEKKSYDREAESLAGLFGERANRISSSSAVAKR